MRSRRADADRHTERYPVLADEPVEVRNPRRKARIIAASFAATIVLTGTTAFAGASYAIDRAESDLRRSRDQFAADLDQRRKERDREQAAMGRDLCTVVTRLPADPQTDAMRRKYGCGPFVVPGPGPTSGPPTGPAPGPPSGPASGMRSGPAVRPTEGSASGSVGHPAAVMPDMPQEPTSAPAQAPPRQPSQGARVQPVPPAQPPPDEPGLVLHVCLPLLGCLL